MFECFNRSRYDEGDHVIFVGEVERYARTGAQPLIFHGGRYYTELPRSAGRARRRGSRSRAQTESAGWRRLLTRYSRQGRVAELPSLTAFVTVGQRRRVS